MKKNHTTFKVIFIIISIIIYFSNPDEATELGNSKPNSLSFEGIVSDYDYKTEIFDLFLKYIENNESEKAFDMLTNECKNELFNNNYIELEKYINEIMYDSNFVYKLKGNWLGSDNKTMNYLYDITINNSNILGIVFIEQIPFNYELEIRKY